MVHIIVTTYPMQIKHRKAITAMTIVATILTTFISAICIVIAITNQIVVGYCSINHCVFSDFHHNNFSVLYMSDTRKLSYRYDVLVPYPCIVNVIVKCYSMTSEVYFDKPTNIVAVLAAMFSSISIVGAAAVIALRYVFTDHSLIDGPPLDDLDMLSDVVDGN